MNFRYYMPTKILFGYNKLDELYKEKLFGKKALLVTSSGTSVLKYGQLQRVTTQIEKAGVAYYHFNGISSNPTRDQIMEGVWAYHEYSCDFIVALGGGSCIDAAKAIAIVTANGGDLWDYFHGGTGKALPVKKVMTPLVAIPTTAGTGSEADQWMVISDRNTGEKIGFGYSRSFPSLAVVDGSLMESVPPLFTAYQGIDALLHSTEAYISANSNPITDALAIKVIELIGKYLPRCVKNGTDAEARENVALASLMSGIVLSNTSMTAEHGMEDGLSGFFPKLPHGAGLIAISLAYYEYIAALGHSSERLIDMAKALGMGTAGNASDFISAMRKLYQQCGVIHVKMSDYGVDPERFPDIIRLAKKNATSEFAAEKKLLTDEECLCILKSSFC